MFELPVRSKYCLHARVTWQLCLYIVIWHPENMISCIDLATQVLSCVMCIIWQNLRPKSVVLTWRIWQLHTRLSTEYSLCLFMHLIETLKESSMLNSASLHCIIQVFCNSHTGIMCHRAPLLLACAYRKCCAVVERHRAIIVLLVYVLNRLVYPTIPLTNVGLDSASTSSGVML